MWPDHDDKTPDAEIRRSLGRIEALLSSIDKTLNNMATIVSVVVGWSVVYFLQGHIRTHGWPWEASFWTW